MSIKEIRVILQQFRCCFTYDDEVQNHSLLRPFVSQKILLVDTADVPACQLRCVKHMAEVIRKPVAVHTGSAFAST